MFIKTKLCFVQQQLTKELMETGSCMQTTVKSGITFTDQVVSKKTSKQFKCDVCEKIFFKGDHHKSHMVTHSKEKPFQCEICDNKFGRKNDMKRHMLVHSDEKPFKCDICNKRFKIRASQKRHCWFPVMKDLSSVRFARNDTRIMRTCKNTC
uniref:Gastrula zinc finger protein XlCGF7.1-like n=1 Tax=Phallusia mammillata TaxID=59560 RepID=A0A6F9DY23_9ASCI|nr:gastrula zinc finger protein XlCGF7.1-like [Phallusia mammillata]